MIERSLIDIYLQASDEAIKSDGVPETFRGPLRALRRVWGVMWSNIPINGELDDEEQADLLNMILIHLNRDAMMEFSLALAENRAQNAEGAWAAQQKRGVVIAREIFRKAFPEGATVGKMLRMMMLSRHSAGEKNMIGELKRAEQGEYGEVISIAVTAFLNSIPGQHEWELWGPSEAKFVEQIEIRMEPVKSALTDILFAQEKAYDRDHVKHVARRLSHIRGPETSLSDAYEFLSALCGYESWNHMSTVLKEDRAAA